jgi:hypothetical protein
MKDKRYIALFCYCALYSCSSGGLSDVVDAAHELPVAVSTTDGRCGTTPRLLVSASTFPRPASDAGNLELAVLGLVASASDLYYVISLAENNGRLFSPILAGSVLRVPLRGGPPTLVASGSIFTKPVLTASSVLLGERNAYPNGNRDAIVSIPLPGDATSGGAMLASMDTLIAGPVTDGNNVYFADSAGIEAVSLADGSTAATVVTLVPDTCNTMGVFGRRLLFILAQGSVNSVPLPPQAGSSVATLGACAPGPALLIPCGSDACWLDEGVNAMMRMDPAGGPMATIPLQGSLTSPSDVAFDGSNFYTIGGISGVTERLGRMALDGGGSTILATMPASGGGSLAVDDACVYWGNALGIFSLAKTAEGPFAQQ